MAMKATFLLLCLALCPGAPRALAQAASVPAPNLDSQRLRAIVLAEAVALHTQAVEFGVWDGEREVLVGALGNSMTTLPATPDMHYRIGGIAETFMSTLLLMLVEQGRIGLDDRISRWFPHLLGADRVTVRMLVADTAGYVDYVTVDDFIRLQLAQPFRDFTDDELIGYSVRDGRMNFAPGSSQRYSHTDNVILGQVIERATGQSMKQLYDAYLFGPLGMKNTQFPTDQQIQEPVLHAYTAERGVYEDCTYWNPSWGSTPAQPTSDLRDLGRWARIFGTGRLISPAHFHEQIAPSAAGKAAKPANVYFAYGFGVVNGWFIQNPSINGYSGGFAYNPATGVALVVEATKSARSTTDQSGITILRALASYVTPATPINF
jgi:CubicO group peptidase (beta-lactamase class C family)